MLFVIPEDMHIAEHTNKNFIKEVAKGVCIRGFVKLARTHTHSHSPFTIKKGLQQAKASTSVPQKETALLLNGISQS